MWKCEAFQSSCFDDPKYKLLKDGKTNKDSSIIVAVKTLKDHNSEKGRQDLLNELGIMKLFDPHPNVVTLLGCCTEKGRLNGFELFLVDQTRAIAFPNRTMKYELIHLVFRLLIRLANYGASFGNCKNKRQ